MFDRKKREKLEREKASLEAESNEAHATIRKREKRNQGRQNFMSYIVNEEHKSAYLWVQKVACSSVKAALLPLFFDLDPAPYEKMRRDGTRHFVVHKVFRGSDYQMHRKRFLRELDNKYRGYFKFGFVRNPWDRLLSCYLDKIVRKRIPRYILTSGRSGGVEFYANMPFAGFVEAVCQVSDEEANGHFRPQHLTICDPGGKPMADFVGRFETLSEDFARVAAEIGAPELKLPERNRTLSSKRGSRHYRDFYDDRLKNLVNQRYEKDVETFGYSF